MCDVYKKKNKIKSNFIYFQIKMVKISFFFWNYNFDVNCLSEVLIESNNEENKRVASTAVPHESDIPLPPWP
jgi:hypothetical protein